MKINPWPYFRFDSVAAIPLIAAVFVVACGKGGDDASIPERPYVAVEALRIGSPDDSASAFTWFRELEVGPNGDVYTFHRQDHNIRVHSAEGRLVRTIGREGEGPGEFNGTGFMGLLGDSLWVLDIGTYRLSFFGLDGVFLGSQPMPFSLGRDMAALPPRPRGLFSDGTIRGSSMEPSHLIANGTITHGMVLRLDSSAAVMDTVATYSLANGTWQVTDPNNERSFSSFRVQPFNDTELVRVSDYQPLVVRVNRTTPRTTAGPQAFTVTALRFTEDTVFTMHYPYTPIPIEQQLVDSLITDRALGVSRVQMRGAPTQERAEQWARGSLYVPAFHPPVSELLLGRDGSIWLRGEVTGEPTVKWRILGPAGNRLGAIQLPAGLLAYVADVDQIWGMELDELDVPHIVSYRVAYQPSEFN